MICEATAFYGIDRNVKVEYVSKPATIDMDFIPDYMERIVQNLLSNSIKFSNPDSVVKVETTVDGGNLLLTVHDDGIGMTAEQCEKIFEPFYQVEGRNRNHGTGVGLSLVSLSVKAMKGSVKVDSEPDKGSTFTVSIPLKSDARVDGTFTPDNYQLSSNTVSEAAPATDNPTMTRRKECVFSLWKTHPMWLGISRNNSIPTINISSPQTAKRVWKKPRRWCPTSSSPTL